MPQVRRESAEAIRKRVEVERLPEVYRQPPARVQEGRAAMTPVHFTARDFKRLTKAIPLSGMNKSEMMHLHLLIVEAALGRRITPEELQSPRFVASRSQFVAMFTAWQKGN